MSLYTGKQLKITDNIHRLQLCEAVGDIHNALLDCLKLSTQQQKNGTAGLIGGN